jgi:hypothetical protein
VFTSAGGGGFGLPMSGSPVEIVVMLVLLIGVGWLAVRLFGS